MGLRPRDIQRLNRTLTKLRDVGNAVLVVAHKPEVMAIADHIVDMGPGAGTSGGTVVFEELKTSDTLTEKRLSKHQALKDKPRPSKGHVFSSRTRL